MLILGNERKRTLLKRVIAGLVTVLGSLWAVETYLDSEAVVQQNRDRYLARMMQADPQSSVDTPIEEEDPESNALAWLEVLRSHQDGDKEDEEGEYVLKVDLNHFMWDKTRKYKFVPNAIVGPKHAALSATTNLSLASQSSVDSMYHIPEALLSWNGPVSLAIFTPGVDYGLAKMQIEYIYKCYPTIFERTAFHFLMLDVLPPKDLKIASSYHIACKDPKVFFQELLDEERLSPTYKKNRLLIRYPQSHARNLARKATNTPFILLTDMDVLLSDNAFEGIDEFLRAREGGCAKCAYVVPVYEVPKDGPVPKNKKALLEQIKAGKAMQYHKKVWWPNSGFTNYAKLLNPQNDSVVHVSHDANKPKFFYEPFYVSLDSVPEHEERFIGFGSTRNTQIWEMMLAGYKFKVLSPVFGIHKGGQKMTKQRYQQKKTNGKLFKKTVARELCVRYQYMYSNYCKWLKEIVQKNKVDLNDDALPQDYEDYLNGDGDDPEE